MKPFHPFVVLPAVVLALGCGGSTDAETAGRAPPPVNTRFELRVDNTPVDLGPPHATKFVITLKDRSTSYISIGANEDPKGGDAIRGASVILTEPYQTRSFDCTPNGSGETSASAGASLTPGPFFGFTATITDCLVNVTYVASDRVVGTFSANAHAPANSSLAGKVSKVEGAFDAPVTLAR